MPGSFLALSGHSKRPQLPCATFDIAQSNHSSCLGFSKTNSNLDMASMSHLEIHFILRLLIVAVTLALVLSPIVRHGRWHTELRA